MWKIIVEPRGPQVTIWRMRIACWMIKAMDTYQVCAIVNNFPLQ